MKIGRYVTAAIAIALIVPSGVRAQENGQATIVRDVDAVTWSAGPTSLPKGTQIALLNGDPSKPGPFVLRLKFMPNTLIASHRHATAENVTVLRGELYHEVGDKVDKTRGEKVAAGGFVYLAGMTPHSVWTTNAETIIQVTGTGPFGLLYVDPKDDPSTR